jgi:hypothetical protein
MIKMRANIRERGEKTGAEFTYNDRLKGACRFY